MSKRKVRQSLGRILRSIAVFAAGAGLCAAVFLLADRSAAENGLKAVFSGMISEEGLRKTLLHWPLLILTGLSAGVSRRAKRFDIGLPGQFMMGVLFAMAGALSVSLPWWACLGFAAIGGALWSGIAGLVKQGTRTGEAVCGAALNLIALYLAQWLWDTVFSGLDGNASLTGSALPALRFADGFSVSAGLPIALLLCLAAWIVARFTVFGYEMRASGDQPKAAKRAGMAVKRNLKLTVWLSGAFSGLAGGMCLLSGILEPSLPVIAHQVGFTGMAVALLSFCHPLGTALAAFVAAGVYTGTQALPLDDAQEAAGILLAATLLGCAVLYGEKRKRQRN